MWFFHISNIAFSCWGYSVSYAEAIGTLFGLVSVYLASRANAWTWPIGIANEFFIGIVFFQVQLYADVLLQIYFFVVSVYGWYHWHTLKEQEGKKNMTLKFFIWMLVVMSCATFISGHFIANLHLLLPDYVLIPAAYPFIDSFIMVASIMATLWLAQRRLENWYLWIAIDVVCVILYYKKGVYFLSFEYLIFLGMAVYGYFHWKQKIAHG